MNRFKVYDLCLKSCDCNHFARNDHSRILFASSPLHIPTYSHLSSYPMPCAILLFLSSHLLPLIFLPILSIPPPSPLYPFSHPFSIHLPLLPPSFIAHLPFSFPLYSFMFPSSSSLPTSIFHSHSLSTSTSLFYLLHTCQQVVQGREGGRGESEDGREQSLQAIQTLHEKQ